MTKSELIENLAPRHRQLAAKDVEYAVKMTQTLLEGNRIEIRGFGCSYRTMDRCSRP